MPNNEIAQQSLINAASNPGMAPADRNPQSEAVKPLDPRNPADVKPAPEKWSNELARRIVLSDFAKYETFRKQNFDERWTANDRILHANVNQEYWEGTSPPVPKASIGVKLEQQQLESLLPYLHEGIFSSSDGIWFDFFPRPNTPPDAATAAREFVAMQTDVANVEYELDGSFRSGGHHGTGIVKVGWCRRRYDRAEWSPGITPNGPRLLRQSNTFYEAGPEVRSVSLRDLYVDSSLKEPNLQKAQSVIERALLSWDVLQRMGKQDRDYKLPNEAELRAYLVARQNPKSAAADAERQQSLNEAGQTTVHLQGTTDPARARMEVLEYWSQDRLVVVLERKWTICNKKNPYGFIPYFSFNYVDVIDQFYGKGFAEILEYEQLLQQGLINSHLNEVALNIHGAIAHQAGSVSNKSDLRPKPGQTIQTVGPPSLALMEIKRSAVTQDWFVALQQSQLRAQQYTGLSDIVTQGAPGVATSVTRTARGVGALANAAHSRIQFVIERIENRLIVPMLDAIIRLNQIFLDPNKKIPLVKDGQTLEFDPLAITNSQFRVELRAGSKMAVKAAMQQTLPIVMQNVMLAMEPMKQQGYKTNINAIIRDMLEAYGWRNRNDWFVQMSPEELQQMQQEQQAPDAAKLQIKQDMQTQKLDHKQEMMEEQSGLNMMGELFKAAVSGKSPAAMEALRRALEDAGAENA